MQPKYYGAAAQYNKPGGFQFNNRWLLIGGAIFLVIILIMVGASIFTAITSGPSREVATLVARENDLATILNKNRDRLHSGDLAKINAEAAILLLSDTKTLTDFMASKYGLATVPEDVTAAESDGDVESQLNDAEQIGRFDQTYVTLMSTKLGAAQAQAEKVLGAASSAEFRSALEQNIDNIKAITEQLDVLKL